MNPQKSIGLTVFAVCCAIYARSAFLAPSEEESKDPLIAAESRVAMADHDPLGLMHDLRKYILGVGVIGLLIAAEDWFNERKGKPNQSIQPTPGKRPPSNLYQPPGVG
jgi:hypothetical protein